MEASSLKKWIQQEFETFNRTPPSNFLSAALQLSVFQLLMSELSNGADEETFSGALLGAFCATSNYCTTLAPANDRHGLSWRRHNKNGKEGLSEKNTGADFAVIIRIDEQVSRAAIFQAKNGQSEIGSFDATHLSPKTDTRDEESQFLRLKEYCTRILLEVKRKASEGIKNINWAHYLVYEKFGIYAVPLSSLGEADKRAAEHGSPGTIRYKGLPHWNFVELLDRGCNANDEEAVGWLCFRSRTHLLSFVESAIDLFDIYEARPDMRADWKPIREQSLSRVEVAEKIQRSLQTATLPMLLISSGVEEYLDIEESTPRDESDMRAPSGHRRRSP